jgi:hypothetical protein
MEATSARNQCRHEPAHRNKSCTCRCTKWRDPGTGKVYAPAIRATANRLRYCQPDLKRGYRVPGGAVGMWCIAGAGFAGVAFSFLVGFFPPTQRPVGSPALYVWLVVGGTVVFTGLPPRIGMLKQKS